VTVTNGAANSTFHSPTRVTVGWVWVDGALVIDHWTPHESMVDTAPLTGGRHELRVAYYQVDGWTELRVDIVRGVERSTGSPGPH